MLREILDIKLSKKEARPKGFDWEKIWEKNKTPIILGLLGLVLVGIGVFSVLLLGQKETAIEILPAEEAAEGETIFVDLEGAVEKPGVYQLPSDSRINDLLIAAGGLSVKADREWVEKNLNLAQKLADGAKIYIPREGETRLRQDFGGQGSGTSGQIAGVGTKININTASASELDSLWGIGEKRAAAIIKNRPYQKIEELRTKKIIPSNVYERIKDEITVY
jgi:competence protein ComEA